MGPNTCHACGNTYDKPLRITVNNHDYTFDCFACAIHVLAPRCSHCGVTIISQGLEKQGAFYCCAHCARHEGIGELQDRA
jgi:hypothetical protein